MAMAERFIAVGAEGWFFAERARGTFGMCTSSFGQHLSVKSILYKHLESLLGFLEGSSR